MKHINAGVAYKKFLSIDLLGRRHYRGLDTAGIKRQQRRNERRDLNASLTGLSLAELRADFIATAPTVEEVAKQKETDDMAQFIAPALPADPATLRPVTIVRKRSRILSRPQSETLMLGVLAHA